MVIRVKDDNGRIHNFPDESTPEMISSAMGLNSSSLESQPLKTNNDLSSLAKKLVTKHEPLINPLHIIKAGLIGLGEGGQNIGKLASPLQKYIPESLKFVPNVNIAEELGGNKNETLLERIARGAGQYSPLIAAGPMGLIPDILVGGAYSAIQSPEDRVKGAEIGASTSGAFNLMQKLLGASHPVIKALARAGIGALTGYGLGGKSGAAEGAAAGVAFPTLAKKLGITKEAPGAEFLKNLTPEETSVRHEAGVKLGTPLTPGEASARPDITAMEANLGKTGEAATERVKIGQQRIAEQKKAINDLYQKISPKDKIASFDVRKSAQDSIQKMKDAREEAVQPLYKEAHTKKVAPSLIKSLENSDATIKNAIEEAMNDPKYQVEGELLNVPKNSIKVLDYAKRKIDAKIAQAENFGDQDAVRVLTASKNKLLDKISGFSPEYKAARAEYSKLSKPIEDVENSQIGRISRLKDTSLKNVSSMIFDPSQTDISVLRKIKSEIQQQNPDAWNNIIRNEMNRLMTQGKKGNITGRSFFDNVLANDNRFKQFQVALEGNPKALEQLNNMKTAWEHLINMETPRTAAGQAKTSMSKARESVQAIIDMYNDIIGGEKQIKALKYLYSPKWQQDLIKVKNMPVKEQKPMMILLLGKTIAPSYLIDEKEK